MEKKENKQNVVVVKEVTLIRGDKSTNELVAYVAANKMTYTKDDEKAAKAEADEITDELSANKQQEYMIAEKELYNKIQDLQQQLDKHISYRVNRAFGADKYVTDAVYAISKIEGYEFFTPAYLKQLGVYHIPTGMILDTHQRCRSFVSSLLRTAKTAHAKEVNENGGVALYIARCKEQIRFNDNLWMSTKFSQMSTLRKLHLVWGIISDCTKLEKKAVLDALDIKLSVRRRDVRRDDAYKVIPIDDHDEVLQPKPYTISCSPLDYDYKSKLSMHDGYIPTIDKAPDAPDICKSVRVVDVSATSSKPTSSKTSSEPTSSKTSSEPTSSKTTSSKTTSSSKSSSEGTK